MITKNKLKNNEDFKPLITIIAATYNAEICLENLIKSIKDERTVEVEFIIIDGGSTDKTVSIIKENLDVIDYWISEKDKGIYDAWNKGIKFANGDWIMFLGADDLLEKKSLINYTLILDKLKNTEIDYISGRVLYINEKNETLKILGSTFSWDKMKKSMCFAHVGSLHNRNLFNEVGLYNLNYKICGDYELLLRKKNKLKSIFLDTNVARMKTGGMSFSVKAIKETYNIRKIHHTLFYTQNLFYFLLDITAFYIFRLKNGINDL